MGGSGPLHGPPAARGRGSGVSPGTRTTPTVDFQLLFEALPKKYLVLDPDLVIVAVSDAYLDGHPDPTAPPGGPPRVRRLSGQPRRSGHRGHPQPHGVTQAGPAPAHTRRHVGPEVRHPAPRGRLRRAILDRRQLAGAGARRLRGLHRPRGRGRHGVHAAPAAGARALRARTARRDGGRSPAARPRGRGSQPRPEGSQRGARGALRPPAGARHLEDGLLCQRQPRAPDTAVTDPRPRRAGSGRPSCRRSAPPRSRGDPAQRPRAPRARQ